MGEEDKNKSQKRVLILMILITAIVFGSLMLGMFLTLNNSKQAKSVAYEKQEEATLMNEDWQPEIEIDVNQGWRSHTMRQAVEEIFNKPFPEITEEDYASILYLEVDVDLSGEPTKISYSTSDYSEYEPDPMNKEYFAYSEEFLSTIQTIYIDSQGEEASNIFEDVQKFNHVKALKLDNYTMINLESFKNLTMLDYENLMVSELLETKLALEQIEVLSVNSFSDLKGIEHFTGLKKLYLEGADANKFHLLTKCENLEALYCIEIRGTNNFSVLDELTNLKTFYVEDPMGSISDLNFIASFKQLENLAIVKTDITNLNFLKGMQSLKSLRLSENGELKDFGVFSELSGLTYLDFDLGALYGNQPEYAEIGKLRNLKYLSLDTVYNLDFLYELPQLEELSVRICFYSDILKPVQKMSNLRSLTLQNCSLKDEEDFSCLKELSQLKQLTIDRMEFTEAADGLFMLESLEELHISSTKFYQPPSSIAVNENLKILDLSYIQFFTTPDSGAYFYVGYEDEAVAYDIFEKFSLSCAGVEELYLDGCMISDIHFVKNMQELTHISLKNCNVSDMTPLLECLKLQYADVTGNPIYENVLPGVEVKMDN